jgi:hypothetical protein
MTLIEYLKTLAARVAWHRFELPPDSPEDPYAGVRQPVNRSPGGRTSAIALEEPTDVGL